MMTTKKPRGARRWRQIAVRAGAVAIGLTLWFVTQSLLGARTMPELAEHAAGSFLTRADGLLSLTAPVNRFLHEHDRIANGLLVVSSLVIDILAVVLILKAIFGATVRPFLGLLILFAFRQISQTICALPAPEDMIWRHPGFPSLLVTYDVANDFFFSGHTAIAVFSARELSRLNHRAWIGIGLAVALFEITTVIVLRAHYSMDIFCGVIAALYASTLAYRAAPTVDRWLG